jgi:hypothetical protein
MFLRLSCSAIMGCRAVEGHRVAAEDKNETRGMGAREMGEPLARLRIY